MFLLRDMALLMVTKGSWCWAGCSQRGWEITTLLQPPSRTQQDLQLFCPATRHQPKEGPSKADSQWLLLLS